MPVGRGVLTNITKEVKPVFEIYEVGNLEERVEQISSARIIDGDKVRRSGGQTGFKARAEFNKYDLANFMEGEDLYIVEAIKKGE